MEVLASALLPLLDATTGLSAAEVLAGAALSATLALGYLKVSRRGSEPLLLGGGGGGFLAPARTAAAAAASAEEEQQKEGEEERDETASMKGACSIPPRSPCRSRFRVAQVPLDDCIAECDSPRHVGRPICLQQVGDKSKEDHRSRSSTLLRRSARRTLPEVSLLPGCCDDKADYFEADGEAWQAALGQQKQQQQWFHERSMWKLSTREQRRSQGPSLMEM